MTVNVVLGPVGFFFPSLSACLPSLVMYGIYPYAVLWLVLAGLSLVVARSWFSHSLKPADFNFGWLLDVFAWGMVALAGSGIASASSDADVGKFAALLTVASISIGLFIYGLKGIFLLVNQLGQGALPADPIKTSYFVVVPINCLFAVAMFKISGFLDHSFGISASTLAFSAIVVLSAIAAFWAALCLFVLKDWFVHRFFQPEFYPSQWGLVCLLVGLEVLALYIHVNYFQSSIFVGFAYGSTALATLVYLFVLAKFASVFVKKPAAKLDSATGIV